MSRTGLVIFQSAAPAGELSFLCIGANDFSRGSNLLYIDFERQSVRGGLTTDANLRHRANITAAAVGWRDEAGIVHSLERYTGRYTAFNPDPEYNKWLAEFSCKPATDKPLIGPN